MTQRDWHMTGSTSVSTSLTTINAMSSPSGWMAWTAQSSQMQIVPEASLLTPATGKKPSLWNVYRLDVDVLYSLWFTFTCSLCPVMSTGLIGALQLRLRGPQWVATSARSSSTAAWQRPMACLWIMRKGCSTGPMPHSMFSIFLSRFFAKDPILLTFYDHCCTPSQR